MTTPSDPLARAARLHRPIPYHSGPTRADAAADLGIPEQEVIKLSSNENPLGAAPAAIAAVEALASSIHEYPASDPVELREALGTRHAVDPACVVTSAGSSTLMHAIVAAFSTPGGRLVRSVPGFDVYEEISRTHDLQTIDVPLIAGSFALDLPAVLDRIDDRTQFVFVTRPNNPTSTMATLDELREITRAAARVGAMVVSDEAYIEFADPTDPRWGSGTNIMAEGHHNLVVTRTLSKAYGLGGLRLGYVLADREVAHRIRAASPKWPTSTLAQAAALAALADDAHLVATCQVVAEQRVRLLEALPNLGLPVTPEPQGNFLMADVRSSDQDAAGFAAAVAARAGVLIRGDFSDEYVRISVGTEAQVTRLLEGIETVVTHRAESVDRTAPPHLEQPPTERTSHA